MASGTAKPALAADNTDLVGTYEENEVRTEQNAEQEETATYADDVQVQEENNTDDIVTEEAQPELASDDSSGEISGEITADDVVVEPSAPETPVTEAPVTEAPVTEAPVTEAPVTEAPVTESPVTEAPATETSAPETEAPETESPATETPSQDDPETEETDIVVPGTETETEPESGKETETESETETETETESESESEGIATQEVPPFDGELHLEYFDYSESAKTVTIHSAAELILLSNLDSKTLKDLTVKIEITGSNVDLTGTTTIEAALKEADVLKNFPKSATNELFLDDSVPVQEENEVSPETEAKNADEDGAATLVEENEVAVNRTNASGEEIILDENEPADQNQEQPAGEAAGNSDGFIVSIVEAGSSAPAATQGEDDGAEENVTVLSEEELAAALTTPYTYQSMCTEENPFAGTIMSELPLVIDTTMFGGLSSTATLEKNETNKLEIQWKGTDTEKCILADTYLFSGSGDKDAEFPVKISAADKSAVIGTLIGTVKTGQDSSAGTLKIDDAIDYTKHAPTIKASHATGNTGLICNTLESGSIELAGYRFPQSGFELEATGEYNSSSAVTGGNAGGLIGAMAENTSLKISSALNAAGSASSIEITSDHGNAGGLVGVMEPGAEIITTSGGSVTTDSFQIKGAVSAGGVAGMAENAFLEAGNLQGVITVNSPELTGSQAGANVGGFIGKYTINKEDADGADDTFPENITVTDPSVLITGTQAENGGNAGGYFGLLELKSVVSYTIGTDETKKFTVKYRDNSSTGGNAWSYGALIGQTVTADISSTLKIQNMEITSTYPVYGTSRNRPKYHGGLIGCVGDGTTGAYVEIQKGTITVKNPHGKFGGAVGCLGKKSILLVDGITVTTETGGQDAKIWDGGGVLGEAAPGSVLELSGTTNLSGVSYDRGDNLAGQLVGTNNCALIYARGDGNGNGWKYIRSSFVSSKGTTYNDLLCYGQVIRLKTGNRSDEKGLAEDFITISDTDHKVTLKMLKGWSASGVTLGSAEDFAVLSIAWNSRGYFGSESGIDMTNWTSIKNSTITLSGDIDLTGTGITGLSRDTGNSDDDTFTGTLDGSEKHKIILAVGETYGFSGTSMAETHQEGCGIVYATSTYHAAQGLFAKTGNATIQNLLLDGEINISNGYHAIAAGGIAATMQGNTTVTGVTAQESIYADGSASQTMSVGGLYGTESGGTLSLDGGTVAAPKITLKNVGANGSWISAGGVMGKASTGGFKLQVKSAVVGSQKEEEKTYASITTDATNYAYVGGLIGLIKADQEHWIEIYDLTIDGFKISAESATEVSGGLFGSIWEHVGVYFMNSSASSDNPMLTVKHCTVSAANANGVGGLAYRSSGIWEIRDYGIDIQSLNIQSGGDVGLLVCRGEKGKTRYESKEVDGDIGALYLKTTAYWGIAYQLASGDGISISTGENGVFDEFVAHTAAVADEIADNGVNGIISIATENRVGVKTDGKTCTTYQNRTAYGKKNQTNGCSRYYYDLDECLKEANGATGNNNGKIDNAPELLLWSVYWYACENIRNYLSEKKDDNNAMKYQAPDIWKIAENTLPEITGTFDMQKYSYYPVRLGNGVKIHDADITFYNEKIETAETAVSNKSTQGNSEEHTQHYTMHCGLFLSDPGFYVSVDKVTFAGSIGKVNSGSGALFAGTVKGESESATVRTATVDLKDVTLAGLKVNDCGEEYAPLLINNIGSYTTLNVKGLGIKEKSYTEGTAAASSLIGAVGDSTAKQISLSFEDIVLPDKKAGGNTGIFSQATLLDRFVHDGTSSVATYNFTKDKEWNGTTYTHGVTYGYEITGTTEYQGRQLWYYDEEGYGTEANRVHTSATDQTTFSSAGYLPYVRAAYDSTAHTHEIKVNQRMDNIVSGCGTYGHPYRITGAREMQILSEYMATGTAPQGWCVTITGNQSKNHVADSRTGGDEESETDSETGSGTDSETGNDYSGDITYKYNGTNWVKVIKISGESSENWPADETADVMDNEVMHQYLLSAYYDLQGTDGTLELSNFGGFGNEKNPFRGVLTSTGNTMTTVALTGSAPANGLIGYGYGCVVRNLEISYENCTDKTLTYDGSNATDTGTNISYYSATLFGGVIGGVLGGDNIIDRVTVKYPKNWLTINGTAKHLIPVGGYVGEVSGGGVIFRNITDGTGLTDEYIASGANGISTDTAYANLYVNPYVGRVLDGFAFYEGNGSLDNTGKNYKINTISGTSCVTVSDGTVNVTSATGLLVLSAIVNSGASSRGASRAYDSTANDQNQTVNGTEYCFGGRYGKVRNASYSGIGTNDTADFALSRSDDGNMPGTDNLPYLIQKYCGGETDIFGLCGGAGTNGISIALTGTDYDMTTFGSGYQGIGARYVSNAILSGTAPAPAAVVPEISSFAGTETGTTITVNMPVKEYVDDNFRTAAVGGVFNTLRAGTESTVKNLTITGKTTETTAGTTGAAAVSLQYYTSAGKQITKEEANTDDTTTEKKESIADVGGFAGTVSRLSKKTGTLTFDEVTVKNLNITAPRNAGGLLGSSITKGLTSGLKVEEWLAYDKNDVNGGDIGVQLKNVSYDSLNVTALLGAGGFVGYIETFQVSCSLAVTGEEKTIGNDSTITSNKEFASAQNQDTSSGAGGVFGYVKAAVNVNAGGTETYQKATVQDVCVTADMYAGGFIGKIDGKNYKINQASIAVTKENKIISTTVAAETSPGTSNNRKEGAGGIVGYAKGNGTSSITECSVKNVQINTSDKASARINQNHEGAGGIVGLITDGTSVTISNCSVAESNIYGAVSGGIAGITKSTTTFQNCRVTGASEAKKSDVKGRGTAGGILGYWFSSGTGTFEECHVKYLNMEGYDWGIGALIGDGDSVRGALYLYDTSVQTVAVTANAGGRWYHTGGIIGDLRCDLTASNLLFSGVKLTIPVRNVSHYAGLLVAKVDQSNLKIQIAGVSIQNIDKSNKDYPLVGYENGYSGYIAFADYEGAALNETKQGSATNLPGATPAEPYVVTSPVCTGDTALKVYESDSATEAKILYGDSVYWEKTETDVEAKNIWNSRNSEKGAHYTYSEIGIADDSEALEFPATISTYNDNQTNKATVNFPVLQITGGDTESVTAYLDILTNGGFSAANTLNTEDSKYVTATAEMYSYKAGKFVKNTEEGQTPAFEVKTDGKGKISFSATGRYDNDQDRFTLLTVTFTAGDHTYRVLVPVLVRRVLEVDFMATFTYGTHFKSEDYTGLRTHVLESYGNPVTAYLTYNYNSAEGKKVEYGWQSYIDGGGDVTEPFEKELCFSSHLPKGTQLTLVDCQDENRTAYYYTCDGNEETTTDGVKIPFAKFQSTEKASSGGTSREDTSFNAKSQSIGEVLKVSVEESNEGTFVKLEETKSAEATVKIKAKEGYEYYRLAGEGEQGKYKVTVNESKVMAQENYYLVVTIPEGSTGAANGALTTAIDNASFKSNIHELQRHNGEKDEHSNTASTYRIFSGYQQKLEESLSSTARVKKLDTSDSKVQISVKDTITFDASQYYQSYDELYQRFTGTLQITTKNGEATEVGTALFPSGTSGTVNFYVYVGNQCYIYRNGAWQTSNSREPAVTYSWTSDGGIMDLPLSTSGKAENAVSLQAVRAAAKEAVGSTGSAAFSVEAVLEAQIPAEGLEVIPQGTLTNGSPDNYAKLNYVAQLSTGWKSLSYSSARANLTNTKVQYYRDEPVGAVLKYDAYETSQLGINLLDLGQNLDASNNAIINTTAEYDMSAMKDLEATLKNSGGIRFTLSLAPKQAADGRTEAYADNLKDAKDYLSVKLNSEHSGTVSYDEASGTWSWTIPKATYYNDEADDTTVSPLIKSDVFDGTSIVTQQIQLLVDTGNVEAQNHLYSNYKVTLSAEVLGGTDGNSETVVDGTSKTDYIIYTLARISTKFVDGTSNSGS